MSTIQNTIKRVNFDIQVTNEPDVGTVVLEKLRALFGLRRVDSAARTATSINPYPVHQGHALIPVYGAFSNDPAWNQYMQNIEEYRERINALEGSLE